MVAGAPVRQGTLPHAAALCLAVLAFGAGCAEPRYHWGAYEDLLYRMNANPGEAPPQAQIDRLSRDVEEARAAGKPVPPGVHAHLAYMMILGGNGAGAAGHLEMERRLYPESAVMVDRMLAGLSVKPAPAAEPRP